MGRGVGLRPLRQRLSLAGFRNETVGQHQCVLPHRFFLGVFIFHGRACWTTPLSSVQIVNCGDFSLVGFKSLRLIGPPHVGPHVPWRTFAALLRFLRVAFLTSLGETRLRERLARPQTLSLAGSAVR